MVRPRYRRPQHRADPKLARVEKNAVIGYTTDLSRLYARRSPNIAGEQMRPGQRRPLSCDAAQVRLGRRRRRACPHRVRTDSIEHVQTNPTRAARLSPRAQTNPTGGVRPGVMHTNEPKSYPHPNEPDRRRTPGRHAHERTQVTPAPNEPDRRPTPGRHAHERTQVIPAPNEPEAKRRLASSNISAARTATVSKSRPPRRPHAPSSGYPTGARRVIELAKHRGDRDLLKISAQ